MIYGNILVTGCGGDAAMAIGRIAKEAGAARRIIGCDIHPHHAGSKVFDAFDLIVRAEDGNYLSALHTLVRKYEIDAIVPSTDAEIRRLLREDMLAQFEGRSVIGANAEAVRAGLDKYHTNQLLVSHGLPAPWTRLAGSEQPVAFPCLLKPRYGRGGRGIMRVEAADMARLGSVDDSHVWQQLILPEDQEYTCGLYRTRDGEVRTIVFRRWLQDGLTYAAEVAEVPAIEDLLVRIAEVVDLRGSINVQLRLDADGPKVFEINPRFSSTVGFRHRFGYRDFVWSLLERRGLTVESYCPAPVGATLYRMTVEV